MPKDSIRINTLSQNQDLDKLVSLIWYDSLYREEWREIPNTEGKSFISNFGRVVSLRNRQARFLTPYVCGTGEGYYYVSLRFRDDTKFRDIKVHRLVAEAFVPNPEGKRIVHHKDFNRFNNRADNLVWVTDSEHQQLHRERKANENEVEA